MNDITDTTTRDPFFFRAVSPSHAPCTPTHPHTHLAVLFDGNQRFCLGIVRLGHRYNNHLPCERTLTCPRRGILRKLVSVAVRDVSFIASQHPTTIAVHRCNFRSFLFRFARPLPTGCLVRCITMGLFRP